MGLHKMEKWGHPSMNGVAKWGHPSIGFLASVVRETVYFGKAVKIRGRCGQTSRDV
jgi:hypothetical protein